MRVITLLFSLLLNHLVVSQQLLGTFSNESEYFFFQEDSTVYFKMLESLRHKDIGFSIKGYGTYRLINDLLIIQAQKYPDTLAVSEIDDGLATIISKDDLGQTLPFVSYTLYSEEKIVEKGSTNSDGSNKYDSGTVDSICLKSWYDQEVGFAVKPSYSYVVVFRSNPVIEKKTVIFKILELNDEILRLMFLDYDHYLPTYNPERLKKIVKKAKWQKTDIRYFEKQN